MVNQYKQGFSPVPDIVFTPERAQEIIAAERRVLDLFKDAKDELVERMRAQSRDPSEASASAAVFFALGDNLLFQHLMDVELSRAGALPLGVDDLFAKDDQNKRAIAQIIEEDRLKTILSFLNNGENVQPLEARHVFQSVNDAGDVRVLHQLMASNALHSTQERRAWKAISLLHAIDDPAELKKIWDFVEWDLSAIDHAIATLDPYEDNELLDVYESVRLSHVVFLMDMHHMFDELADCAPPQTLRFKPRGGGGGDFEDGPGGIS